MFTVRLHYGGKMVVSPSLAYVGGKVQVFDYCDAETFELGSVDAWAFRVGLRYGEFILCAFKDPMINGFNGVYPLKTAKNLNHFLNLSAEEKFIDVYFLGAANNDLIAELIADDCGLRLRNSFGAAAKSKARMGKVDELASNLFGEEDVDLGVGSEPGVTIGAGVHGDVEIGVGVDGDVEIGVGVDGNVEVDGDVEDVNEEKEAEDVAENVSEEEVEREIDADDMVFGIQEDHFSDGELGGGDANVQGAFLEELDNNEEVIVPELEGDSDDTENELIHAHGSRLQRGKDKQKQKTPVKGPEAGSSRGKKNT